jgi:hypothetical protein
MVQFFCVSWMLLTHPTQQQACKQLPACCVSSALLHQKKKSQHQPATVAVDVSTCMHAMLYAGEIHPLEPLLPHLRISVTTYACQAAVYSCVWGFK